MITDPVRELTFNGLDLLGTNSHDGKTFTLAALGDDATWGNPQPVEEWIVAMLQDGAILGSQRADNREARLRVRVTALDGEALAAGEAALVLALHRGTLEWTPPDGWAPTTVFEVEAASLEHVFDDIGELRLERVYGLRMVCQPYARSVDKVTTVAAPTVGALVEATVDACASTSTWTASDSGPTVIGGSSLRTTHTLTDQTSAFTMWLRKTATIDLTSATTPYIRVDATASMSIGTWRLRVDGTDYAPVATVGSLMWFSKPFQSTWGTVATLELRYTIPQRSAPGKPVTTASLTVADVSRTNMTGTFGTTRQQTRVIDVPGSVRGPGDLTVTHPNTALGSVLVYTYPTDLAPYSPMLHPFRSSGPSITTDTARISGGYSGMSTGVQFTIPQGYVPAGQYELLAMLRSSTTAGNVTIAWSATIGSTTLTGGARIPIDTSWGIASLDMIDLPPVAQAPDSTANVVLTLTHANVLIDTAWIFNTEGDLTWVDNVASTQLTIATPTPDHPHPAVWDGVSHATGIQGWGQHKFTPPQVSVCTVTSGPTDTTTTLSGYPWWHTHAGL